jgi:hypothetical protein
MEYGNISTSVHGEILVALLKGGHLMFRAGFQLYPRARGHVHLLCLLVPTSEVDLLSSTRPAVAWVCYPGFLLTCLFV